MGVTYKTAWRMCHEIRKYMAALDSDDPLGGAGSIVEIDETLIGGSVSGMGQRLQGQQDRRRRHAGDAAANWSLALSPSRHKAAMHGLILDQVLPGTTIHTDELGGYKDIDQPRLSAPDSQPQSRASMPVR